MKRLLLLLMIPLPVGQLSGCHYYVKAVPDIIFSSEPFTPPTNHNIHNTVPKPPETP